MRRGFTLIELLIVIAIIGTLAGLLFPAVGMALNEVRTIQCTNNLSQISKGVTIYANENDEKTPPTMMTLISYGGFPGKSFVCPMDKSKGADVNCGRPPKWNEGSIIPKLIERGSSYFYEGSSDPEKWDDEMIGWFYYNLPKDAVVPDERKTWQQGKINQQRFGLPRNDNPGVDDWTAFPSSGVPILRCYHHHPWRPSGPDNYTKNKVINIALALNTFQSIPYWELQYETMRNWAAKQGTKDAIDAQRVAVPKP